MKNCKRCGIPINKYNKPQIYKDGICELCKIYDNAKKHLTNFTELQKVFKNAILKYKDKYKYDVAVGFSGGKDSSYICHTLKTKYGCRVLAVTANFGFMPSGPALKNIKRVTRSLNIDHVVVNFTSKEIKKAFSTSIKNITDICGLCTALCWDAVRKVAIKYHIPCYIMGSDRGQLFREFYKHNAKDFLKTIKNWNYKNLVKKNRQSLSLKSTQKKWDFYQNLGISKKTAKKIYPVMKPLPNTNTPILNIQFFAYHPYNEKEIKKTLTNQTYWKLPADDHLHAHHDCLLHDAAQYAIRKLTGGVTLTAAEICVDSREGTITRREALEVIKKENKHLDNLTNPYESFETLLGIKVCDLKDNRDNTKNPFIEFERSLL